MHVKVPWRDIGTLVICWLIPQMAAAIRAGSPHETQGHLLHVSAPAVSKIGQPHLVATAGWLLDASFPVGTRLVYMMRMAGTVPGTMAVTVTAHYMHVGLGAQTRILRQNEAFCRV